MVSQSVMVPILLPGWPFGISRVIVQDGTATKALDEVVVTPDGVLATVRVCPTKPEETRLLSRSPRYAVQVAQSTDSPEWTPTGNGNDTAARYSRGISAGEAARRLIDLLQRMG
jgi:hypothetical protein